MKLGIILAIIVALMLGAATAAKVIYDAGYNERDRIALVEAEQSRAATQATINSIEKRAIIDAQKKADLQISANVERAVKNARAANPACSLLVPNVVRDALKRH